nr:hypothetical protein [Tanacetum cinerariifolium]
MKEGMIANGDHVDFINGFELFMQTDSESSKQPSQDAVSKESNHIDIITERCKWISRRGVRYFHRSLAICRSRFRKCWCVQRRVFFGFKWCSTFLYDDRGESSSAGRGKGKDLLAIDYMTSRAAAPKIRGTMSADFRSEETTKCDVFRKYTDLCATGVTTSFNVLVFSFFSRPSTGTHSISPPVSIHRVKPCVNPATRIPGAVTTNFSAAAATNSGGNPQVVYNEVINSPCINNEDSNHTSSSFGISFRTTAEETCLQFIV